VINLLMMTRMAVRESRDDEANADPPRHWERQPNSVHICECIAKPPPHSEHFRCSLGQHVDAGRRDQALRNTL